MLFSSDLLAVGREMKTKALTTGSLLFAVFICMMSWPMFLFLPEYRTTTFLVGSILPTILVIIYYKFK